MAELHDLPLTPRQRNEARIAVIREVWAERELTLDRALNAIERRAKAAIEAEDEGSGR